MTLASQTNKTNTIIGITGATGFVGGAVLQQLLKNKHRVRLYVRDISRLDHTNMIPGDDLEIIVGDLNNVEKLHEFCKGLNTVIHCAAVISASHRKEYDTTNIVGTMNVVNAVKENKVKRFIYLSSLAATRPQTCFYAHTKRKSEISVKNLDAVCDYVILRPPAVYGPADKGTFELFKMAYQKNMLIMPSNKYTRNALIYVFDIADVIVKLVEIKKPLKGIFELDDGVKEGYSWENIRLVYQDIIKKPIRLFLLNKFLVYPLARIMDIFALVFNKKAYLSYDKAKLFFSDDWLCKGNRIENYLDWQPSVEAKEGFKLTLEWYKKNKWL